MTLTDSGVIIVYCLMPMFATNRVNHPPYFTYDCKFEILSANQR